MSSHQQDIPGTTLLCEPYSDHSAGGRPPLRAREQRTEAGTVPESEKDFFSKAADDVFTFEADSQGHAMKMTLHTGGKDIPIKRID